MFDTKIDLDKLVAAIGAKVVAESPPCRVETKNGDVHYLRPNHVLKMYTSRLVGGHDSVHKTTIDFVDGTSTILSGVSADDVAIALGWPSAKAASPKIDGDELALLGFLQDEGPKTVEEAAAKLSKSQSKISAAAYRCTEKGWIVRNNKKTDPLIINNDGKAALAPYREPASGPDGAAVD